ncbi:hypothetical protein GTP38_06615 [Duganella sp. FT94W]|uniref:Uncharacterized protein n=1 Tax=Duganella lactea TaxID=2692173 RepID=A0ABW9V365_9BURK|nr:hypothetical protein [Duganella lactea]MYM34010.1 hypothetical protein [Duganella lactea]
MLDRLYFNQALVFSQFTDTEMRPLEGIINSVAREVEGAGATGVEAELWKHYVLCFLEVLLADDTSMIWKSVKIEDMPAPDMSDDMLKKISDHQQTYFAALILSMGGLMHELPGAELLDIAMRLAPEFRSAPAVVRYRLVDRSLAMEHPPAPLMFLAWMAESDILHPAKYKPRSDAEPLDARVLARLGLLSEFEQIRELGGRHLLVGNQAAWLLKSDKLKLSEPVVKQLLKEKARLEELSFIKTLGGSVRRFEIEKSGDAAYMQSFFSDLSLRWSRPRAYQGKQSTWTGALGGALVSYTRRYTGETVYNATGNKDTISAKIAQDLLDFGFRLTANTLYRRYTDFDLDIGRSARQYHIMLNNFAHAWPAYEPDGFYLQVIISREKLQT